METAALMREMIDYFAGDPRRIQHFTKVYEYARLIGLLEGLDTKTQFTLETAAIVHDIGIRTGEEKYGRNDGKIQEELGPEEAKKMLEHLGYDTDTIQRVCYLVGHHHTYHTMDGMDYQILVEADFLVNLYEDESPRTAIETALERIFRTKSGTDICRSMFGIGAD